MATWKLKSKSDTERVYAQVSAGSETGKYRYVMNDGTTHEVGPTGLNGRHRKAKDPRSVRLAVLAGTVGALAVTDIIIRLVG